VPDFENILKILEQLEISINNAEGKDDTFSL
jgi:hypothetical protein